MIIQQCVVISSNKAWLLMNTRGFARGYSFTVVTMSKERPEQPRHSVLRASVRVTVALSPSDFYAQIGTGKYKFICDEQCPGIFASVLDEQLALFDEYSSSLSSWCDEHCGDVPELPSLGMYVAIKNPAIPRVWFRAVVTSHLNRYPSK